jgi:hypothetical protein
MAFVLYLFVLLISAAGVMFGLDLMSSPLPSTPNVPIGRSVRHIEAASPHKMSKVERAAAEEVAAPKAQSESHAADRALSPVYPARPGPSAPVVADTSADTAPETVGERTENTATASIPAQQAATNDCNNPPPEGARRFCPQESAVTTAAVPTPRPAPRLSATYLPAKPQKAERNQVARDARGESDELAEVVRIVKRQHVSAARALPLHVSATANDTREMSEVERIVRKMTRGREARDISVLDGSGRVIIVHTGGPTVQAYRE